MVAANYEYTSIENHHNLKNLANNITPSQPPYSQINPTSQTAQFFSENQEIFSENQDLTPIQQFYDNASVLITGSTGFLGKILVEKLLRSCPTISCLYLLVRTKKGKNMEERVDEMFDDVMFTRLKRECPKYKHKVVGVGGDCMLPQLGLSLQDRRLLIDEVSVIFHVAATVRFDEKLKTAVAINIRSPQDLLQLGREMLHLKAFMHVSTVFGNCPKRVIEEKIYPPPIDGKKLMLMTESVPEKILDDITPVLLDGYPNTYAFTKQIAEDVVRQEAQNMPVGIFRPAIVVSTYKEPLEAWINNMYGPTGVCAGAGVGILRTLHCDHKVNANLVPVDMCVNSLIATAWEVGGMYQKAIKEKQPYEIPVYNYESSTEQPINWGRFMALSEQFGLQYPPIKIVWYYCFGLYKYYPTYVFFTFLLHTIPAFIIDSALFFTGKSPRMLKVYKKIHKFSNVISYFAVREWTFKSTRVRHLLDHMTDKDNDIFFSDLKKLDWVDFYRNYLKGVRVYLMKDPLDTLAKARKKWNRLFWAHQTLKVFLFGILIQLIYIFIKYIFSLV